MQHQSQRGPDAPKPSSRPRAGEETGHPPLHRPMVAPFVEAASETGYRLCRAPPTAVAAADEEGKHETRLARCVSEA